MRRNNNLVNRVSLYCKCTQLNIAAARHECDGSKSSHTVEIEEASLVLAIHTYVCVGCKSSEFFVRIFTVVTMKEDDNFLSRKYLNLIDFFVGVV